MIEKRRILTVIYLDNCFFIPNDGISMDDMDIIAEPIYKIEISDANSIPKILQGIYKNGVIKVPLNAKDADIFPKYTKYRSWRTINKNSYCFTFVVRGEAVEYYYSDPGDESGIMKPEILPLDFKLWSEIILDHITI